MVLKTHIYDDTLRGAGPSGSFLLYGDLMCVSDFKTKHIYPQGTC